MTNLKHLKKQLLNWNTLFFGIAIFIIFLLLIIFDFDDPVVRSFSIIVFTGALYTFRKKYEHLTNGLIIGLLGGSMLIFADIIIHTYSHIKEWDFLGFFYYGKLGLSGGNFYDPDHTFEIFNNLTSIHEHAGPAFVNTIPKVGFWYPPPTMFLFVILGFLELEMAAVLWKTGVLIALIFSIKVSVNFFYDKQQHWSLMLILILFFFIYGPTKAVITLSQTGFLLLILLMLILKNLNNWKSGLFLVLAVIIKPLAIIWAVYFVITKRFIPIIAMIASGVLISLITIAVFGFDLFFDYLFSSPTKRISQEVFAETSNQSLYGVLIRVSNYFSFFNINGHGLKFISLGISIVLMGINIFASLKIEKKDTILAFLLFIPTSLIIYPATLEHYSILLIPVYFYFILRTSHSRFLLFILGATIFGIYVSTFSVHLFFFLLIIFVGFKDHIFKIPFFGRKVENYLMSAEHTHSKLGFVII